MEMNEILELMKNRDPRWQNLWKSKILTYRDITSNDLSTINTVLCVIEHAFKSKCETTNVQGFSCWQHLIEHYDVLNLPYQMDDLILVPLKNVNSTYSVADAKLKVWDSFLNSSLLTKRTTFNRALPYMLKFLYHNATNVNCASSYPFLIEKCAILYFKALEKANNAITRSATFSYMDKVIKSLDKNDEYNNLASQIWLTMLEKINANSWYVDDMIYITDTLKNNQGTLLPFLLTSFINTYPSFPSEYIQENLYLFVKWILLSLTSECLTSEMITRLANKYGNGNNLFDRILSQLAVISSMKDTKNLDTMWCKILVAFSDWFERADTISNREHCAVVVINLFVFPINHFYSKYCIEAIRKQWKISLTRCLTAYWEPNALKKRLIIKIQEVLTVHPAVQSSLFLYSVLLMVKDIIDVSTRDSEEIATSLENILLDLANRSSVANVEGSMKIKSLMIQYKLTLDHFIKTQPTFSASIINELKTLTVHDEIKHFVDNKYSEMRKSAKFSSRCNKQSDIRMFTRIPTDDNKPDTDAERNSADSNDHSIEETFSFPHSKNNTFPDSKNENKISISCSRSSERLMKKKLLKSNKIDGAQLEETTTSVMKTDFNDVLSGNRGKLSAINPPSMQSSTSKKYRTTDDSESNRINSKINVENRNISHTNTNTTTTTTTTTTRRSVKQLFTKNTGEQRRSEIINLPPRPIDNLNDVNNHNDRVEIDGTIDISSRPVMPKSSDDSRKSSRNSRKSVKISQSSEVIIKKSKISHCTKENSGDNVKLKNNTTAVVIPSSQSVNIVKKSSRKSVRISDSSGITAKKSKISHSAKQNAENTKKKSISTDGNKEMIHVEICNNSEAKTPKENNRRKSSIISDRCSKIVKKRKNSHDNTNRKILEHDVKLTENVENNSANVSCRPVDIVSDSVYDNDSNKEINGNFRVEIDQRNSESVADFPSWQSVKKSSLRKSCKINLPSEIASKKRKISACIEETVQADTGFMENAKKRQLDIPPSGTVSSKHLNVDDLDKNCRSEIENNECSESTTSEKHIHSRTKSTLLATKSNVKGRKSSVVDGLSSNDYVSEVKVVDISTSNDEFKKTTTKNNDDNNNNRRWGKRFEETVLNQDKTNVLKKSNVINDDNGSASVANNQVIILRYKRSQKLSPDVGNAEISPNRANFINTDCNDDDSKKKRVEKNFNNNSSFALNDHEYTPLARWCNKNKKFKAEHDDRKTNNSKISVEDVGENSNNNNNNNNIPLISPKVRNSRGARMVELCDGVSPVKTAQTPTNSPRRKLFSSSTLLPSSASSSLLVTSESSSIIDKRRNKYARMLSFDNLLVSNEFSQLQHPPNYNSDQITSPTETPVIPFVIKPCTSPGILKKSYGTPFMCRSLKNVNFAPVLTHTREYIVDRRKGRRDDTFASELDESEQNTIEEDSYNLSGREHTTESISNDEKSIVEDVGIPESSIEKLDYDEELELNKTQFERNEASTTESISNDKKRSEKIDTFESSFEELDYDEGSDLELNKTLFEKSETSNMGSISNKKNCAELESSIDKLDYDEQSDLELNKTHHEKSEASNMGSISINKNREEFELSIDKLDYDEQSDLELNKTQHENSEANNMGSISNNKNREFESSIDKLDCDEQSDLKLNKTQREKSEASNMGPLLNNKNREEFKLSIDKLDYDEQSGLKLNKTQHEKSEGSNMGPLSNNKNCEEFKSPIDKLDYDEQSDLELNKTQLEKSEARNMGSISNNKNREEFESSIDKLDYDEQSDLELNKTQHEKSEASNMGSISNNKNREEFESSIDKLDYDGQSDLELNKTQHEKSEASNMGSISKNKNCEDFESSIDKFGYDEQSDLELNKTQHEKSESNVTTESNDNRVEEISISDSSYDEQVGLNINRTQFEENGRKNLTESTSNDQKLVEVRISESYIEKLDYAEQLNLGLNNTKFEKSEGESTTDSVLGKMLIEYVDISDTSVEKMDQNKQLNLEISMTEFGESAKKGMTESMLMNQNLLKEFCISESSIEKLDYNELVDLGLNKTQFNESGKESMIDSVEKDQKLDKEVVISESSTLKLDYNKQTDLGLEKRKFEETDDDDAKCDDVANEIKSSLDEFIDDDVANEIKSSLNEFIYLAVENVKDDNVSTVENMGDQTDLQNNEIQNQQNEYGRHLECYDITSSIESSQAYNELVGNENAQNIEITDEAVLEENTAEIESLYKPILTQNDTNMINELIDETESERVKTDTEKEVINIIEEDNMEIKMIREAALNRNVADLLIEPVLQKITVLNGNAKEMSAPEEISKEMSAPEKINEIPAPEEITKETPAPEEIAKETPAPEEIAKEIPTPEEIEKEMSAPEKVAQEISALQEKPEEINICNEHNLKESSTKMTVFEKNVTGDEIQTTSTDSSLSLPTDSLHVKVAKIIRKLDDANNYLHSKKKNEELEFIYNTISSVLEKVLDKDLLTADKSVENELNYVPDNQNEIDARRATCENEIQYMKNKLNDIDTRTSHVEKEIQYLKTTRINTEIGNDSLKQMMNNIFPSIFAPPFAHAFTRCLEESGANFDRCLRKD